jgi:hypothetical protein
VNSYERTDIILRFVQACLGVLSLGGAAVGGWFLFTANIPAVAVLFGAWAALGVAAIGAASIASACTKL